MAQMKDNAIRQMVINPPEMTSVQKYAVLVILAVIAIMIFQWGTGKESIRTVAAESIMSTLTVADIASMLR